MDDDSVGEAGALDALGAWLLTEDAYEHGGVPDEVLSYLQDHVNRLLGPHATQVAGDFLRQHVGAGGDLAGLARDRSRLLDLLALIEEKRRRGFEPGWHADCPAPPAEETYRPEALLVMAEYSVEDPVWDRPRGRGGLVSLAELGVSDPLVQRLRAWNETFERSALTDPGWAGSESCSAWVRDGLNLARELQQELPGMDVRYFHADDDRPLRSI